MPADGPRSFNYNPRRIAPQGEAHSWFVRILKIVLPVLALVLVGILLSRLSGEQQQNVASMAKDEKTTPGQIELVGAKYEGVDDEGRAYTVTADKAVRAMDAPDTVIFTNPIADITLSDKTWVAVKGQSGSFDRATETLVMKDNVSVFHDSGYEIRLQDLTVDLKKQAAKSTQPVEAQGPLGAIHAADMEVKDQGDMVVFGGPMTMTIYRLKGRG